jgi:hypothetical protein
MDLCQPGRHTSFLVARRIRSKFQMAKTLLSTNACFLELILFPFYLLTQMQALISMLHHYISMASNLIKNFEYRRCVLCGKKRVAPINRNPLRYHRYGACPSCTRLDDFEEQMKRYREKAKDLRYVNTPTS